MTTKTGRANKNDACSQPNCPYSISCHQDTRTLSKLPFPLLTNSYRPLAISKYQHGWNALDRPCWVKRRAKRDHHWKLWSRHQGQQIWKATGLLYSTVSSSVQEWQYGWVHTCIISHLAKANASPHYLCYSPTPAEAVVFNSSMVAPVLAWNKEALISEHQTAVKPSQRDMMELHSDNRP